MRAKPKLEPIAKRRVRRPAPDADMAEIYRLVRTIPRGRVITYGEVAELVGRPSGHRFVAKAMRICPEGLPWQRVVGRHDARRSHISIHDPEHAALQRSLLEKEGVVFDAAGYIVMARSGWLPRESGRSKRLRSGE
jgi:methylated-DNA-protein-cysteine methyltransferase-like protein